MTTVGVRARRSKFLAAGARLGNRGTVNAADSDPESVVLAIARPGGIPARAVLDALPAAIYTTDAKGKITYYNAAAARLWGHRPTIGESEWCGSWKLYWPDGAPLPHDE